MVLGSGAPEVVAAMEKGEISLHKAVGTVRRERRPVEAIQRRNELPRPPKAPPSDGDRIIRQVMSLASTLSGPDQERLTRAWRMNPRPVAYVDIGAWREGALDSQRRQAADDFFNSIVSVTEKLKHNDRVVEWLRKYERGDASEPCDDEEAGR